MTTRVMTISSDNKLGNAASRDFVSWLTEKRLCLAMQNHHQAIHENAAGPLFVSGPALQIESSGALFYLVH